jgi:phage-related protein
METAITQATSLIRGGLGGYVVINTSADGTPNEILIMDAPSIDQAINVIRMNMNGIGFSTTGYNGLFRNAWDIQGNLNADFITAGSINGGLIRAASILTSALEINAYEAVNGSIENITYDGNGMHIARKDSEGNIVSEYQSLFTELGMRVINDQNEATLIAEGDTVQAINLTAQNFLRVSTEVTETGTSNIYKVSDRFQGFWSNVHQKPMVAVYWEET